MKQLTQYIQEKLKIGSKSKVKSYKYTPKDTKTLIKIIKDKVNEGDYNLNDIDVYNITDVRNLFADINSELKEKLTKLQLDDWNTCNFTTTRNLFLNCSDLEVDVSKWDMSKVNDMSGMFRKCTKFKSDLSKWDVSSCLHFEDAFSGCKEFDSDLSEWKINPECVRFAHMFSNCTSFKGTGLDNWEVNPEADTWNTIRNCELISNKPNWIKDDD